MTKLQGNQESAILWTVFRPEVLRKNLEDLWPSLGNEGEGDAVRTSFVGCDFRVGRNPI